MRRLCLDTDYLVALLRDNPDAVRKALEIDTSGNEVVTTSMNAFEVYVGAFRSRERNRNTSQADNLLSSLKVLNLDMESSRKSGEVLSDLLDTGLPIDIRDAIIAGIALVNGCTLITRNSTHFKRVTGLSVEPW